MIILCMSATVSFTASAVLLIVGVATILQVKSANQKWFAVLPLLFSVQQFAEGMVWLSMQHEMFAEFKMPSIYTFLIFAEIIWPVIVPISIWKLEKDKKRKLALALIILMASVFSVYLTWAISLYAFDVVLIKHHIFYTQSFPDTFVFASGIVYFISTVISPFLSQHKSVRWLGFTILISFLLTQYLYGDTLISVWCFFAAIGSIQVYFTIKSLNKKEINIIQEPLHLIKNYID